MENTVFKKSILALVLLGLLITLAGSFMLRPTADDYWFGAYVAQHGVWGATVEFWNTWSSFVVGMFGVNVLVGLPLATLPLGISSAIPFWCGALSVGYISYKILMSRYTVSAEKKPWLFIVCTFIWLSFLFVDSMQFLMLTHHFKNRIALGIVHWQTLGVGYVFWMSVLMSLFLYFLQHTLPLWLTFVCAILWGVAMGMMGTAIVLSFLAVLFCVMCWQGYLKTLTKLKLIFYLTLMASSAVSTVASMKLSPGHTLRLVTVKSHVDFSFDGIVELFLFTFLPTFHRLSELYLNLGTVLTLGAMILFWLTLGKDVTVKPGMSSKQMALFLTFCCLVFAAVARFSQAFSYSKPWHFIPTFMVLYLSLFFWSHYIAQKLQKRVQSVQGITMAQRLLLGLLCIQCVFIAVGVSKIYEREKIWAVGPAPVRDGKDIEREDWLKYWNDLNKYREEPFEERKPQ